jgi:hypothetical protein
MENVRTIVDYADEDQAKEMRDALYSELQNRVMSHIEAHKKVVASNMFGTQTQPEEETSGTQNS